MATRQYYLYILTNKNHTVLYTGVTNALGKRLWEHKAGLGSGFVNTYRAWKLVYFETFEDVTKPSLGKSKSKPGQGRGNWP